MVNKDLAAKERIDKKVRGLWQEYRKVDEAIVDNELIDQKDLKKKRQAILANINEIRRKENNG